MSLHLGFSSSSVTSSSAPRKVYAKDTGYAWLIMLASLLINACSWGINSSFSVFLADFLNNSSYPGATALDYNFITGLAFGLGQAGSPFAIALCNYVPHRVVVLIGAACIAASFIGGSFVSTIGQLYVTLGLLQGVGIFLVYIPSSSLVASWFDKKLGLANGVAMAGTGLGGVVFTLAAQHIIDTSGVRSSMRILGIVASVGCAVTGLFCKKFPTDLDATVEPVKEKVVDKRMMNRVDLWCVIFWTAISCFANAIVLFTITSYGRSSLGVTPSQSSIASSITNVGSIVGRPLLGLLLDLQGQFNMTLLYTMLAAVFVFGLWIPCPNFIALCVLCFLLGNFLSASAVSPSPMAMRLVGSDVSFLAVYGAIWFLTGIVCIFSVPAVMALRRDYGAPHSYFLYSQIFTGCLFLLAFGLLLISREYKVRLVLLDQAKKPADKSKEQQEVSTPGTPRTLFDHPLLKKKEHEVSLDGETPVEHEANDYFSVKHAKVEPLEPVKPELPSYFSRMFYPIKV
jgi:MFS family permease